jgi:hypothetical protein
MAKQSAALNAAAAGPAPVSTAYYPSTLTTTQRSNQPPGLALSSSAPHQLLTIAFDIDSAIALDLYTMQLC